MSAAHQEMSDPKVTYSVVPVDAETASRWLERNRKNRGIRQQVVERYRSDMAAGRWENAGDPIRFDYFGNLIDGQHRLTALAELHDVSLPMLIVRGLPPEAQRVMDQGAKRTPGDQLGLMGVKSSNNVASTVKQVIAWESEMLFRDSKVKQSITAPRIEQWVREHSDEVEQYLKVLSLTKQNDAPPSISGAASVAFSRIDPEKCEEFFTLLARGAGTEGHPIVTLDKRLQRIRRDGVKLADREYLALIILAWNAWRDSKTLTKFQRPRGGRFTEDNFPIPH